jgi:tetratricopeptide (TPR) repeat protein
MNYYWIYYAATFFLAYAEKNPKVAVAALAFFVMRPVLPDPVVIVKNLSRISRLRRLAQINAANAPARRDLGLAYLEMRMPVAALHWLDAAKKLDPKNQELDYLRGLALLKRGDAGEALRAFGAAVGIDPDKGEPFSSHSARGAERTFRRFGEAYLGAAEALERLGRLPQAEEALEVASSFNTSSLEPLIRLSRVRRRQGKGDLAREALREARRTWGLLPGFMKRKQLGLYVRALLG